MEGKMTSGNRIYRYEFNKNLVGGAWRYLLPAAIAVQTCLLNRTRYSGKLTAGEYFCKFLEGMEPMASQPGGMERFLLPGDWCLFFILLLYFTGKTAKDFNEGIGMQVLLRTQKVQHLWYAKSTECILNIVLYFTAAYVAVGLFCVWQMKDLGAFFMERGQFFVQFFLPVLTFCAISIWQMVFSMMSNSMAALLIMCALLVTSAYFEKCYLIGNYLMKIRVETLLEGGISGGGIAAFLCVLLAAGLAAGSTVIRAMDYTRTKGDL